MLQRTTSDEAERKRNSSEMLVSDGHYLKRLCERLSAKEIGDRLGISPDTVNAIVRGSSQCRRAYDLAAKAVLMEITSEEARPTTCMVKVPKSKKELLVTFLKGAELKFSFWEM